MGDMKTPDFDDLLAAFDIPDPTSLDAKEAIQATSEENESPLKPAGMCMDESVSLTHSGSTSDGPAVSVIVKNTSRQESFEAEKGHVSPSLLHNGFRGPELPPDPHGLGHNYGKFDSSFMNGENDRSYSDKLDPPKSEPLPTFSQFSPISSPEPDDTLKDSGFGEKQKHSESPYFPPPSVYISAGTSALEVLGKFPVPELSMFDHYCKKEEKMELQDHQESDQVAREKEHDHIIDKMVECKKELVDENEIFGEALAFNNVPGNKTGDPKNLIPELSICSSVPPRQRLKPAHSKLSSCVAALVALQAKKVAGISKDDKASITKEHLGPIREGSKGSPKMPKSPKSPRSPTEITKKSIKPPDSPRSICSDSSGKGSPSVAASSPPAIPKVRIKTIKTSSGEIKRTVTSILPDPDDLSKSPVGSPVGSANAEETSVRFSPLVAQRDVPECETCSISTQTADDLFSGSVMEAKSPRGDGKGDESMNKPSETSSPCLNSSNRVTKVAPVVSQQSKKQQQQSVTVQASPSAPANLLPKAVHLANLNLVPHSVAASVTAKSSVQRRSQSQLTQMSVSLVHQVKKAAPVVVEVFNKVLHGANPVPIYAPNLSPPADSKIRLPSSGYSCLECGDAFALEKSLSQHYGRRSVHIEVLCTQCSKTLLFYNRCSLLKHARDHKSKGLVMQCSQLLMKPISADQMFSQPPTNSPAPAPQPPSASPKASPVTGSTNPAAPAMPLYPDPLRLVRYGVKCLECNKQVQDYIALAAHYQRMAEETEGLTCQVCQMMLPNQCSFCAHQRIHAHKSPYCCPECGALCRLAYFQTHVKENCLHYARKVGFRCIHCGVVFVTLALLKGHIQERHCQVFHKCAFCPMAFKSASGTAAHSAAQHPAQPHKASQLIYKCSCETVFNKKKLMQQHFYQNTNKLMVGVFKCPDCQLVFMQKQLLMQHVKNVHGVPRNVEELPSLRSTTETPSGRPGPGSPAEPSATSTAGQSGAQTSVCWGRPGERRAEAQNKAEMRPRLRSTGWTCQDCHEWLPDRESYVSHMKKSHGRIVKRYPCRQCECSFHTVINLRRHIRNNHDTAKKVYTCWYCTEDKPSFPQLSLLENHVSLMHGIKNLDLSQTSKARPSAGEASQVNDLKRPAAGAGGAPSSTNGAAVPTTKRPKALFQCAKCSFATDSGPKFQSHIPQHQADSSTAQCLLCGLCYTSASSLNRHLFIVHKVRDPEEAEEGEPEGPGKGAPMETNENGCEDFLGEENQWKKGQASKEDWEQDTAGHLQAAQDQNSHMMSTGV
ncbi:zinc finger protein 592 [Gracilinanus agilis]|uniref:zinc finger protein 592 n=1 Tax=Gracilinanus agilis TaxID=191870 RepID=UPI001CFCFB84|nr:zinc finger protein 592 [Gracilinanus agilis]